MLWVPPHVSPFCSHHLGFPCLFPVSVCPPPLLLLWDFHWSSDWFAWMHIYLQTTFISCNIKIGGIIRRCSYFGSQTRDKQQDWDGKSSNDWKVLVLEAIMTRKQRPNLLVKYSLFNRLTGRLQQSDFKFQRLNRKLWKLLPLSLFIGLGVIMQLQLFLVSQLN